MTRVIVHIGTLRLSGLEASAASRFTEGLRLELARALGTPGSAQALEGGASPIARLVAAPVRLTESATPYCSGMRVAGSVAKGVLP